MLVSLVGVTETETVDPPDGVNLTLPLETRKFIPDSVRFDAYDLILPEMLLIVGTAEATFNQSVPL